MIEDILEDIVGYSKVLLYTMVVIVIIPFHIAAFLEVNMDTFIEFLRNYKELLRI